MGGLCRRMDRIAVGWLWYVVQERSLFGVIVLIGGAIGR